MDFGLSDEQLQLQQELGRALARAFPLKQIRAAVESPDAMFPEVWGELCAFGVPGLLIDAEHGGLGLGMLDAVVVAEQLGRCVAPAPFVATTVMAPIAIALAGSPHQRGDLLPRIARGEIIAAVGISEHAAGARSGAGIGARDGHLTGTALFVIDSAAAHIFILADRADRLHVVHRDAPGLRITPLDSVDRTRSVCRLELAETPAEPLSNEPARALARMRDAGRVALAADTLGAASHMLEKAVEYAGIRKQFGRAIGSFQAVKHMCAEMAAELEPARSLIWYSAYAQDEARADSVLATAHAKAYVSDAGRLVARKSVETHGGVGVTDDLGLHFWFKRIGWNHQLLGSPERLRSEAAALQDRVA